MISRAFAHLQDAFHKCLLLEHHSYLLLSEPISALPYSTLSITDLVEVTTRKKPIVRYNFMPVPPSAYADMKDCVNVLRAALMRKSRIEAKKCAQLKKLDGFLRLPLEIIFAVFEYVHPIDVYHLSHSFLIFRDLLKDQIPLLKRIYQSHGVPLWPPKIPYDEWSNLLFGDSICDKTNLEERVGKSLYGCTLWACNLFCELSKDIDKQRRASLKKLGQRLARRGYQDRDFLDWSAKVVWSRWRDGHQADHKRRSWKMTIDVVKSIALQDREQQIHSKRTQMMELGYTTQPQPNLVPTPSSSTTKNPRPSWCYPPVEIFLTSGPCKAMIIRGLFHDDEVKKWARVKKGDLEKHVTIPKGLVPSIAGHNKMGLVISTFTCSLCRDFVHWRNLSARQLGRMGFLGGRHYGRGTESSLARINNGKVDNLDDLTWMVLFGWEDVKHHLVCIERPMELKNRIRSGFEVGGGTPGKSTPAKSSNEGGVEGIVFNTRASELMLIVLGKLGLDPARTTADDLDGLGKGFLCYELLGMSPGLMLKQKDNSGAVNTKVLEWRDFVVHILRHRQRNRFPFSVSIEKLLVKVVSMDSK